jgi:hypothetical protein
MATYRFLADHSIGQFYYSAGTTASTADVANGTLPVGWTPSNMVDPLDASALSAFYSAGPQLLGLARTQFNGISVSPPVTYWRGTPLGALTQYQLTGLGSALGPISM